MLFLIQSLACSPQRQHLHRQPSFQGLPAELLHPDKISKRDISIVSRKIYVDKIRKVANYCGKKYIDSLAGKMGVEPMTFGFGDQRSTV